MSDYPHTMIKRLVIENYRSLKSVDITLGPLTILVGPNSAGKSNLVDALRFVRDALFHDLDSAVLDRQGLNAIRRWTHRESPVDIRIQLYLEAMNWSGEYSFALTQEGWEDYTIKGEHIVVRDDQGTTIVETTRGKWTQLPKGSEGDFLAERVPVSSTRLMLPFLTMTNVFPAFMNMYEFLRDMNFYSLYPNNLREPQKHSLSYPLFEQGSNLASVLRQMESSGDSVEISEALSRVVGGVTGYSVIPVGSYLVTKLHHAPSKDEQSGPIFDLTQESDGTLRMLGILTALYQKPPRPLISVEEPELTIHPGALGVLCDVIREASLRSQIIITTHSPDLISRFSVDALRIVEREQDVTYIGPITEVQREAIVTKLFSIDELMRIEGLRRAKPIHETVGE